MLAVDEFVALYYDVSEDTLRVESPRLAVMQKSAVPNFNWLCMVRRDAN